jgi:hypothetical protein
VEAPEAVEQRVTLPRLAAGGVFALGFKKKFKRCYVVVQHTGGLHSFFEIIGRSAMDTRVDLTGVMEWLQRYGEDVRAAAEG